MFQFLCVAAATFVLSVTARGGELEEKLADICRTQNVPGLIAASVGPDGIIESAAVGVRKRGTEDSVAVTDQFSIASNSKSFTATLSGALVDDGVIKWSDTIADAWPDQPVHREFRNVTLEQLLAHTGGLQSNLADGTAWASFFGERHKPQQERARMCFLLLTKAPEKAIGEYSYSNLGYVIAAAMLEERGGKSFEQLMQERVFRPLEMTNTEFYSAKKLRRAKDVLWGHGADGKPVKPGTPGAENPTVYASCGTIRTTIADWAKHAQWHLGERAAPVLKSEKTWQRLHEGGTDRGAPGQTYGFGWIQFQSRFGHTLQHTGSNTNQYSLIWVMPEARRATLVVTNTGEKQAFTACDAVTAAMMQSPAFQ